MYFIHAIYKETHGRNDEYAIESCADVYRRSIEFNGLPVNRDAVLSEYDRKGRLVKEYVRLGELINGNVCISLLSGNNCRGCIKNEVLLLRKLGVKDKILFIFDSTAKDNGITQDLPITGYYEMEDGDLIAGLESMQEMPLLFYVENGLVIASCVVSNYSRPMTNEFHDFLKKRLNDE